jgi:tetratricopeptide (TPR) repeat protein
VTAQETLNIGLQHHQAGRLAEAEAVYRQILSANPRHPDALNLMGALAAQAGKYDIAAQLFGQASAAEPGRAEFHSNLATVLEARGQHLAAAQCLARAVRLQPGQGDYHFRLGNLLLEMGRLDDAISCLDLAAQILNGMAGVHNNLGIAFRRKGELNRAIAWYGQALSLQPDYAEAANNLGEALFQNGQIEPAIAACRQALAMRPDYLEAELNLGNALRRAGRPREAVEAYEKAQALRPNYAPAHDNMANAFNAMGEFEQAERHYRRAAELDPAYPSPRWNLGLIHLRRGEFERGWELYDWRLKMPGMNLRADVPGAAWDGSELGGRRILLVAEQGLGDAIQFVRYAPMVRRRGGRVVLACPRELLSLLSRADGVDEAIAVDGPLPGAEAHCALLSLPRIFGTNLSNIPGHVPYLAAEPALKEQWRARMDEDQRPADQSRAAPPRIGLAWAGGPRHREDHLRSFSLSVLAPLVEARPEARFFSLQVGEASWEVSGPPPGMEISGICSQVKDFSDTAAIIENLDLVITADTAVAHLAGALGKPVWVMLPFVADWRWMSGRTDSPWYPTMRLFRQEKAGDWETVARRTAEALREF